MNFINIHKLEAQKHFGERLIFQLKSRKVNEIAQVSCKVRKSWPFVGIAGKSRKTKKQPEVIHPVRITDVYTFLNVHLEVNWKIVENRRDEKHSCSLFSRHF